MKRSVLTLLAASVLLVSAGAWAEGKIKVAVVTGGHEFAEKPFLAMFEGNEGVECTHVVLKDDSELFEDISAWPYQAIVLYNMTQKISEKRQQNFVKLLDRGVGLVVLHHAIAAYSEWAEFRKIIGARYFLSDVTENGKTFPRSQYEHGVDFKIHAADTSHPITQGISDFTVNDETYKGYLLEPDNHVLLTTDHPKCQKEIGWTRTYGKARVCYLQMGHGDSIFSDPNYRRLVLQAIRWTGEGRDSI
jgi:hypothetical protein